MFIDSIVDKSQSKNWLQKRKPCVQKNSKDIKTNNVNKIKIYSEIFFYFIPNNPNEEN